ncbi:hypothetical protein [Leifsonia sp. 21MFCrub1.1]|uniref:hypothetical protein n=1 Tax=Leifsonia sp. 21MFCrub1.1 TaxID=1798223 RepID=UPI0008929304|nr:hypothetical protein [Leifsonia sp. 21MFCrub1.1]SEA42413.1 hypothetical protein SAMN04515680_0309 [Leifsonia sp. 21MFCrub1.1]
MRPSSWRLLLIAREALHNTFSRSARAVVLVAVAGLLGSAGPAVLAAEAEDFRRDVAALEARGSAVLHLGASNPRAAVSVTRDSCEALSLRSDVERSGILVEEGDRSIPELGARVPVFAASTSLFPGLHRADALVGSRLEPAQYGRFVQLGEGVPRRAIPAGVQPEGIPTNGSILVPLASHVGTAEACIVVLHRGVDPKEAGPLISAQLDVSGGAVSAIPSLQLTSDPLHEWTERPGQWVILLCAGVGGLTSALFAFARSSELAAYRMSGTSRSSLALILLGEEALRGGLFAAAAAGATCVVAPQLLSVPEAALWACAGASLWCVVASIGIGRALAVPVLALARDR